jgi:hypothetical protein
MVNNRGIEMTTFLAVAGSIAWLVGFVMMAAAPSAIQEILGGVFGVSGSVLIVGFAIVSAVNGLKPKITPAPTELEG